MTRLLPAKIGPIEGGMGHEKPSGSYIHRFVSFDIERICFLIGHCPHGHPNNNMQVLTRGLFFFCITLYTYLDPQHSKKTLWQWWRKENKVHITSYCVLSIPACLPVQRC